MSQAAEDLFWALNELEFAPNLQVGALGGEKNRRNWLLGVARLADRLIQPGCK